MKKRLGGSRIIKTGLAVLLTAWVCELIGWPPVFAVITAIVTIEPTVSDSIKKGIVRFPASAIGSAYAVIFISLFGNSPITYTLAAVLTIATCFKLNLHAGLLVATLTSVAMVEVIHEHLFIAFLIRLGTTTIGLVISTAVNMFILPPDYREDIFTNIGKITNHTAYLINKIYSDSISVNKANRPKSSTLLIKLEKKLNNTLRLIQFQKDELKYHPLVASEEKLFLQLEEQAKLLQKMHGRLEYLLHHPMDDLNWNEEEIELIRTAVQELADSLQDKRRFDLSIHLENKQKITSRFWQDRTNFMKNTESHSTTIQPEIILLYELSTLFNLVERFLKENRDNSKEPERMMT